MAGPPASGFLYQVEHQTRYLHAGRVTTSQHVAYLEPRTLLRQRVQHYELAIDPAPASMVRRLDYFGNVVHQFTILTPYTGLEVTSHGLVGITARTESIDPDTSTPWEVVREALTLQREGIDTSIAEFSYASPYVALTDDLAEFARPSFEAGRPVIAGAMDLMRRIHRDFTFLPNVTSITTPATRILADRHGVCQDFAHLQIASLRSLGIAARYVSGYLLTDPPPGQARLVGADASHAWLAVYCPRLGWVDLDPTNDILPDARHVTLAWGRDYGDVSPLRGVVLGGDDHTLHVGVSVAPVERVGA
jgi:transglutaminase-like putative cysteine protease